jgi:hypothetical protein
MSSVKKWLAVGGATTAMAGMVALVVLSASGAATATFVSKKRCHYVVKRVHGKKKRVRACRKVTPKKKLKCPSERRPPPGSVVTGGLLVDDLCTLTDVTIKGGVTVTRDASTSQDPLFEFRSGRVTGGITVNKGNLFLGVNRFTGELTHGPVTIKGGITMKQPMYYNLAEATITGGITMNGGFDWPSRCDGDPTCFTGPAMCGNKISGNVTIRDDNTEQVFVGDPGEQFYANGNCEGNTIHGSVFLTNSNFARKSDGEPSEIEGDTVTGSINVDHSTAEVYGNTVGGSLLCTNGSIMHPPPPDDPSGKTNTVTGTNTCF